MPKSSLIRTIHPPFFGCSQFKIRDINIESGIPMPMPRGTLATAIRLMRVGESVVVPRGKDHSARAVAYKFGRKLTARAISDCKVRLWRIE